MSTMLSFYLTPLQGGQPNNLPPYQPTNLPTYQPTNLQTRVDLDIYLSSKQSYPTNHCANWQAYHPTNQPAYQPTMDT